MLKKSTKEAFVKSAYENPDQRSVVLSLSKGIPVEMKATKVVCRGLAILRALYQKYQEAHWTCKGESYYSDHLLFQRLYENIEDEMDGYAEKFIGIFGEESISTSQQSNDVKVIVDLLGKVQNTNKVECLLELEKIFQMYLSKAYDYFEQKQSMTLGLDDYIMSLASSHETHLYLLRQRLKS